VNFDESDFYKNFSQAVGAAEIIPTRHNVARAQRAEAVLVCRNGQVPPLEPLNYGPYHVLSRSHDFFWLKIGSRTDTVSTRRLDPAAAPAAPPCQGPPPGQRKEVTFYRPHVAPAPSAVPAAPTEALAAAGPYCNNAPSTPALGL
jgi:hypothetical protein